MRNRKLLNLMALIFCFMLGSQSLFAATGDLKNMFPPGNNGTSKGVGVVVGEDGTRYVFQTPRDNNGEVLLEGQTVEFTLNKNRHITNLTAYTDAPIGEAEKDPTDNVTKDSFLMAVEYSLSDESTRDALAVGASNSGAVSEGDELEAVGMSEKPLRLTVHRVEKTEGGIGLTLRGIEKSDIRRGMVIAKPGSISAHKVFKARIQLFNREEGGLNKPIRNGSTIRLSFWGTTDVTGEIFLAEGREMVMPGDNATLTINLAESVALDKKLQFKIREGGRTIGAGTVSEIVK